MSGTVDQSTLREDVWQSTVDRLTPAISIDLEQNSTSLRNEDLISPFERSRTTKVITIKEFYELFHKILDTASTVDELAYKIRFSRESPPVDSELPCFTAHLISRVPYADNSGRREYKPRFMESQIDKDNPGDILETYLRRQTNNIQLKIWAKTGAEASRLAEWVEDKFYEYLWAFQWGGLAHPPLWIGRGEDTETKIREQRCFYCPLTFQIITGKITYIRETALRQLQIRMGIISDDH